MTLTDNVTVSSAHYGIRDEVILVVVAACPTFRVPEAELAPKLPCAAYAAVKV